MTLNIIIIITLKLEAIYEGDNNDNTYKSIVTCH